MNNPFHQIVARQRTVPVQPNTNNQVHAKGAFSDAVLAWEQASVAQRQGWKDYAATVTYTGPLGDYHPSGRMLAIAQYQMVGYLIARQFPQLADGLSMDPPEMPGLLVIQNPQIGAPAGGQTGFSIECTNNNGENVFMYTTRSFQQSLARNFYKGPFLSDQLTGIEIPDTDTEQANFHGLNDSQVYFCRFRFISDQKPYRFSQESILRAIAETAI